VASAAPNPVASAAEHTPLRIAVIGAGNMGRHHVRNYAAIPESQIVAVVDMNPATAELAATHGARHYTDYLRMLDEVKPDAVSVVVPTPLHAPVATEVMRRGIHCLVEKPIASTVAEADELIGLAERQGVVFTVGHIERYNPVVRKLKELIDQGRLGDITSIVSKRVGGFPVVEPKTDVIIDLAVHDIEIISFLLDRYPSHVYGHGSRTLHSAKIDAAELLLDYGTASGFVQANWTTPVKVRTIAVTGSAGYVEGNYITQELSYYEHNLAGLGGDFRKNVAQMADPRKETIQVDFHEPLEVELRAFLQTIRGQVKRRLVSPQDAREALRIALTALDLKAAEHQSKSSATAL
jgi:UDP-N-acetylglucosamine 3-dehydrogenase